MKTTAACLIALTLATSALAGPAKKDPKSLKLKPAAAAAAKPAPNTNAQLAALVSTLVKAAKTKPAPRPKVAAPVASPATHHRFTTMQDGELVRLTNEDAGVSILVPPGFAAEQGGPYAVMYFTSPGGEELSVTGPNVDREVFRDSCRSVSGYQLMKSVDFDECRIKGGGTVVVKRWFGEGLIMNGSSKLLDRDTLARLVEVANETVLVRTGNAYQTPRGASSRNADGTQGFIDNDGVFYSVIPDLGGASTFEDRALEAARAGRFGPYKKFTIGNAQQGRGALMAGVVAMQKDGQPMAGVLAHIDGKEPLWALVLVPGTEPNAVGDVLDHLVDTVLARRSE